MLSVFSHNLNTTVGERNLYAPAGKAGFILIHGKVGSGHDVVAMALSYHAPRCRDWRANVVLQRLSADLQISVSNIHGPNDADLCWYMGELGWDCDVPAQLDGLIGAMNSGAQVIAYVHAAVEPILRLKQIYEQCGMDAFSKLERLIAERGCRTINVTRMDGGEVYVRTNDTVDRELRLAVDNTN